MVRWAADYLRNRSADFESSMPRVANLPPRTRLELANVLPIGNRRYGRLETCATSLRRPSRRLATTAVAVVVALVCFFNGHQVVAQGSDEEVLSMIVELLRSPDRDMRGLALQEIREGLSGTGATRKISEILPTLPPPSQAALLDALSDRSDRAARPAVIKAISHDNEAVRVSALRALRRLGTSEDLLILAAKAAAGSELEQEAARQSLAGISGENINPAILQELKKAEPPIRAELLRALAAREAADAAPTVLHYAADPDRSVRLAALNAAQLLANEKQTAAIIQILASATDAAERSAAEAALLAVCTRGGEACADAVLEKLPNASPPMRLSLLRALAIVGGPKALRAVIGLVNDADPTVRDGAVRTLSRWTDSAAAPHLLKLAREPKNASHQILALRGVIRLAGGDEKHPANLEMLQEAWTLAKRLEEKRLVLGVLGGIATAESLALTLHALDDPDLGDEAAMAFVMIAEKLPSSSAGLRPALDKIVREAEDASLRERAGELLKSSRSPER
jgi:HEAT repeat protein